ncbi:MAG: sigma-70 family RNA polymerase sigma factor [Ruminococcus sp.]|uniref:RNA polymerase sigma factor n=1 Tax=Ruminococcus sp. TaxID=41978 RepID=UPI0025CD43F5|nr:sigma-70 family RNA polymerase sigma factor [Ruminococcus sp.]MBR5681704.1 sigma-70 family RNA polymerase sigma factor [Ruminococcus sp.]
MEADIKTLGGGDGQIITVFTQKRNKDDSESSVNQLIIDCTRSKECLEKLYLMFKDSVFAVAYSITQDYHLSEDCVAETFVRLTRIKRFSASKGDGKGFILTVARNVALEYRRRFKREVANDIIQNYGDDERTVEDSIYINQLLKELNDKQRQTVVLKCCADMTFKQIAKVMKCPESTVKSRYQKAIAILKVKAGDNE